MEYLDLVVVDGEEIGPVEGVEGAGVDGVEELGRVVADGQDEIFVHSVRVQTGLTPRMMSLPSTSSSSLAVWSALSATVLALQAAALVVAPRLLLFLSRSPRDALTPLEAFLALHFALFLFALALAVLLNASLLPCSTAAY